MEIKTKTTFVNLVAELCGVEKEDVKIYSDKSTSSCFYYGNSVEYSMQVHVGNKVWRSAGETLRECYEYIYDTMKRGIEPERERASYRYDLEEVLHTLELSGQINDDNKVYVKLMKEHDEFRRTL